MDRRSLLKLACAIPFAPLLPKSAQADTVLAAPEPTCAPSGSFSLHLRKMIWKAKAEGRPVKAIWVNQQGFMELYDEWYSCGGLVARSSDAVTQRSFWFMGIPVEWVEFPGHAVFQPDIQYDLLFT